MYSTEVSKTLVSVWLNNILVDHSMQNTFQFSRIRCVEEDLTSFLTKFSLELIFLNCFKNWVNHFQRRIERYSVTTTIRYKKNVIKNWRQNTSQQWQRRRRRQKRLNDARSRSTRLIVFQGRKNIFILFVFFSRCLHSAKRREYAASIHRFEKYKITICFQTYSYFVNVDNSQPLFFIFIVSIELTVKQVLYYNC